MLAHRLQRWPNNKTILDQCIMHTLFEILQQIRKLHIQRGECSHCTLPSGFIIQSVVSTNPVLTLLVAQHGEFIVAQINIYY